MFIWKISNTRELEQLGREKREKPLNPEAIESTASVPWCSHSLPGWGDSHPCIHAPHNTQEFGISTVHTLSVPL